MKQMIIDQLDLDKEKLLVRNMDLTKIMKTYHFDRSIEFLMAGEISGSLDKKFKSAFRTYFSNFKLRSSIIEATRDIKDPTSALMIGVLIAWEHVTARSEKYKALTVCGLLPCILADIDRKDISYSLPDTIFKRPVIEIVHYLVSDEKSSYCSSFEMTLVSMIAGFGAVTPTIMAPRVVAGTGAGLEKCLLGSMAAAGKFHVGACNQFIELFEQITTLKSDLEKKSFLRKKIRNGETIYGFGHPILNKDPRVCLKRACRNKSDFATLLLIEQFMHEKKNVRMNIDGIAGFIFLKTGIRRNLGSLLFIYARSFAVLMHSFQKRRAPPFGNSKVDIRKKYKDFPFKWI